MTFRTYDRDQIATRAGISLRQLEEIEQADLVRPVARTAGNEPVYDEANLEEFQAIQGLLGLGYELVEVRKIRRKVGMPARKRGRALKKGKLLTVGELAKRAGLNPRTIKHWEEQQILTPEAHSEGGFRLYTENYVLFCQLIRDCQLFGYSLREIKEVADLFRRYSEISSEPESQASIETVASLEEMLARIEELRGRMRTLRQGIRRWEGFTDRYAKRIQRLKGQMARRMRNMTADEVVPPMGEDDAEEEMA